MIKYIIGDKISPVKKGKICSSKKKCRNTNSYYYERFCLKCTCYNTQELVIHIFTINRGLDSTIITQRLKKTFRFNGC